MIPRREAAALGLTRYNTGKPCLRGHHADRFVVNFTCVECAAETSATWCRDHPQERRLSVNAWRDRNPEKDQAATQRWRGAHPERVRAHARKWKRLNKLQARRAVAQWHRAHKEPVSAYHRTWAKNNPLKIGAWNRARRARSRNAEGRHTQADIENLLRLQRHRCANCCNPLGRSYHVDHVYPLAKGGSNWKDNIQLLCQSCNLKKSAKDPILFAQEQGRLL
jgi:hypothetical protein